MQAADTRLRDAQRLAGLVDRLDDEDAAARRLAVADLVQAGPVGDPDARAGPGGLHQGRCAAPAIDQTLTAIGPSAVEPLIAALAYRHELASWRSWACWAT